ncbi:peroxiredoxin [Zoogloea sp.]|uniref:peroxiredoxin n=1 Tax=Zoogloea sp. TaxID=49181 RepID=UPI0035B35D8B
MTKIIHLLTTLSLGLATGLAQAALNEGSNAPDFKTQASLAGKSFTYSLKDALRKGPVVVYFYPSAYTNGCNLQAHTFAEQLDKFSAAGASVVGVSLDSIDRLNRFSADPDYCAGKLAVASDADGKIAKAYALSVREAAAGRKDTKGQDIDHGFAERTTFVIQPDGRIVATIGNLAPVANVQKALEVVRGLSGKGS